MRRIALAVLRRLGTLLLFLAAALCFAPTAALPFLDRLYYEGPDNDHFDGERFFNPDGPASPVQRRRRGFMSRWASAEERARWPDSVPVMPTVPPRQVGRGEMRVTWIGHSTVLVQVQGLNILTDPIWSERASPLSFAGPRRVRAPGVRFEHLPRIDLVLISHNHYDHLDLPTLRRLWQRDSPAIVTSLGNDTILRGAGIEATALDWGRRLVVERDGTAVEAGEDGGIEYICADDVWTCGRRFEVIVERNQHWSSRWLTDRNRALWSAFTVVTPSGNIFFAGDTGWGDGSWVREAARHGPLRLALIPIGAYEPREVMRAHHVDPEEAVEMFRILNPAAALGIHWGTFQLTFEPIDEPRQRLAASLSRRGIDRNRFVAIEAGGSFSVPPAR